MQIQRHWLVLAGFFGLTATMLGAYGAHGLAATGIAPFTPWCCLAARGWGSSPRPVASVLCWDGRL